MARTDDPFGGSRSNTHRAQCTEDAVFPSTNPVGRFEDEDEYGNESDEGYSHNRSELNRAKNLSRLPTEGDDYGQVEAEPPHIKIEEENY